MRTRLPAMLTALALVAGACSSDSDDAADTTTTTEAPAPGSAETSTVGEVVAALDDTARFEGTVELVGRPGSQLAEPVEILVAGSIDPQAEASQVSVDVSGIAQAALGMEGGDALPDAFAGLFDEPLELITIEGTSWMRFPLLTTMTGVETDWVEVPSDATGELTAGLGLGPNVTSPTGLLDQLRDAEAEVTELGTEEVRGTETTHHRLLVDVRRVADDLSAEDRAQLEEDLGGLDEALPVEVWVDDDGRLHRYAVELAGAAEDDADVESVTVTFELFDHGTELEIEAPPEDDVTPIGDLAGIVGGGPTGGSEGTEGSGG